MKIISRKRIRGFTLIELMIAIVIIGILAAVAYPGYQNSVRKSRRATAQGDLMAFAALMERSFTARNTYLGMAAGGANTGTPPPPGAGLPGSGLPLTSPMSGGGQVAYNFTILAATATTYTLNAAPVIPGPQAIDGVMTLTSVGQRTWDRNNDGAIAAGENTWDQ